MENIPAKLLSDCVRRACVIARSKGYHRDEVVFEIGPGGVTVWSSTVYVAYLGSVPMAGTDDVSTVTFALALRDAYQLSQTCPKSGNVAITIDSQTVRVTGLKDDSEASYTHQAPRVERRYMDRLLTDQNDIASMKLASPVKQQDHQFCLSIEGGSLVRTGSDVAVGAVRVPVATDVMLTPGASFPATLRATSDMIALMTRTIGVGPIQFGSDESEFSPSRVISFTRGTDRVLYKTVRVAT